jgi:hypothetical protein
MSMRVFRVVTQCGLVCTYQRFEEHTASISWAEAVCSSETLVSTYKSTRRYSPEDQHRHLHFHQNLKSHIGNFSLSLK